MLADALTLPEQAQVARALADAATAAGLHLLTLLHSLGYPMATLNQNQSPLAVWQTIISRAHAGGVPGKGWRSTVVVHVLAAVVEQLQGNEELIGWMHRLGSGGQGPCQPTRAVFLSYATADRLQVDALRLALQPALQIFQDHISIQPGQDWFDTLRDRAGASATLVVWLTSAALRSSYIPYEVGVAQHAGARTIPIEAGALTTSPVWLTRFQALRAPSPLDIPALASTLLPLL